MSGKSRHDRRPLWSTDSDRAHKRRLIRAAWFTMYRSMAIWSDPETTAQGQARVLTNALRAAATLQRLNVPFGESDDVETPE